MRWRGGYSIMFLTGGPTGLPAAEAVQYTVCRFQRSSENTVLEHYGSSRTAIFFNLGTGTTL